MFFDDRLIKTKTLGKVWRAAHNQINPEIGDVCLEKICLELEKWIESDNASSKKRMSLRTSAALIGGAARNYKQEVQLLIRDIVKLDAEIVTRRRKSVVDETSTGSSVSSHILTPEQMMCSKLLRDINTSTAGIREASISSKSSTQIPQINHSLSQCSETLTIHRKTTESKSEDVESSENNQKELNLETSESTEKVFKDTERSESNENKSKDLRSSENTSPSKVSQSPPTFNNNHEEANVQRDRAIEIDKDRVTEDSSKETTELRTSESRTKKCRSSFKRSVIASKRSGSPIISYPKQVTAITQDDPNRECQRLSKRKKTGSSRETESNRSTIGPDLNKSFIETSEGTNADSDGNARNAPSACESIILESSVPMRKNLNKIKRKEKITGTQRKDQETQTSDNEIDKSLPFGCLLIHNTYDSRTPCKIVWSSLNPKVRNLM